MVCGKDDYCNLYGMECYFIHLRFLSLAFRLFIYEFSEIVVFVVSVSSAVRNEVPELVDSLRSVSSWRSCFGVVY